jgi:hypothetical protein
MKDKNIWPVIFNNKAWYEKDCDKLFTDIYEFREQLNYDGGIYMSEGICLYPDGTFGEW